MLRAGSDNTYGGGLRSVECPLAYTNLWRKYHATNSSQEHVPICTYLHGVPLMHHCVCLHDASSSTAVSHLHLPPTTCR